MTSSEEKGIDIKHVLEKTGQRAIRWALGLTGILLVMFTVGYFVPLAFTEVRGMIAMFVVALYLQTYGWVHSSAVIQREIVDTDLAANDNLVSTVPGIMLLLCVVVRLVLMSTINGTPLSLFEWLTAALVAAVVLKDVIVNSRIAQKIALLTDELAKVK